MKLPKFLIAENPLASEDLFIIHTRRPRFIARVNDPEIEVIEWLDDPPTDADRLAGLMSRLGDWYRAYCDWEDDQSPQMN